MAHNLWEEAPSPPPLSIFYDSCGGYIQVAFSLKLPSGSLKIGTFIVLKHSYFLQIKSFWNMEKISYSFQNHLSNGVCTPQLEMI
jgi:hypothetical protein